MDVGQETSLRRRNTSDCYRVAAIGRGKFGEDILLNAKVCLSTLLMASPSVAQFAASNVPHWQLTGVGG